MPEIKRLVESAHFIGDMLSGNWPRGCFIDMYDKGVRWNTSPTGARQNNARQICISGSETGTEPPVF